MVEPVVPAIPAAPAAPVTPAAPAVAAPAPVAPSPAAPAQTPAAASATPDKPAAAASPPAKEGEVKPAEMPPSLLAEPEAPKPDAPAGAPEKYDFKIPEGVTLNQEEFGKFETFAREKNLNQDLAQSLLDRHVTALKTQKQADRNAWFDLNKNWQGEIMADKIVGGDKLPQSKQAIGRLINALGADGPKFREALDFTGAGNNPAVFRGLVKLAEKYSEGTPVKGNPASPASTPAGLTYASHRKA